ncbi:MAG: nucleotide exchange factor GrpE [Thermoanaerobaculia bacterium]
MSKKKSGLEEAPEVEEDDGPVELDTDEEQDVEEVMREAMAAVESAEEDREDGLNRQREEIDRLERELADLRDRSMRTLADFDNYRKRAERERQELRRYALLEPLRDVLEVVDNLERAASAGGSAEDLKQGVEMIVRQLQDFLRRHGVSTIESRGEVFDPAVHEAVSRRESEEVSEPVVDEEYQRGYRLHDRLLRPARVVVAVPPEGGADAAEDSPEDGGDAS